MEKLIAIGEWLIVVLIVMRFLTIRGGGLADQFLKLDISLLAIVVGLAFLVGCDLFGILWLAVALFNALL